MSGACGTHRSCSRSGTCDVLAHITAWWRCCKRRLRPPPRMVASSQEWKALRAIREVCPEVDTYYSIDVAAKLDLFLSVSERDERPRGVSCRHTLLTRETVAGLHSRGLLVVAWTVDDIERARELASWGVDGLTTHKVAEFAGEFGVTT
jgi:glycerophosphoryl diester phosphodiesterase